MTALLEKGLPKMTLAMLVAGAFLRVAVWLQQRSIFIDEANLIRNWLEKRPAELFAPLGYEQFCPPLFSLISKGWIAVAGVSELTVRAVPLASGLAMLGLFWAIGKRLLQPPMLLAATAFAASGGLFLKYSSECKQYSTDGFVALLLVFLALKTAEKSVPNSFRGGLNWRKSWAWAVGGAAAIWLSMPSVFVLAGVGFFFFWQGRKRPGDWQKVAAFSAAWLASFGFYFFKILRNDAAGEGLKSFHRRFFLPFPPRNGADWATTGQLFQDFASASVGQTAVAAVVAAVGFSLGVWRFWRTDRAMLGLFLVPILATLGASAFEMYSLTGRLILFLIPFFQILIFAGLDSLFQIKSDQKSIEKKPFQIAEKTTSMIAKNAFRVFRGLLLACLFIAFGSFNRFEFFAKKFGGEAPDIRAALGFLAEKAAVDEAVFIEFDAAPAARFYLEHGSEKVQLLAKTELQKFVCCDPEQREKGLLELKKAGFERVWLVSAGWERPGWLAAFCENQKAEVVEEQLFYRAGAFLIAF